MYLRKRLHNYNTCVKGCNSYKVKNPRLQSSDDLHSDIMYEKVMFKSHGKRSYAYRCRDLAIPKEDAYQEIRYRGTPQKNT